MSADGAPEVDWTALDGLRDPILVVALRGWFDVAGAATTAVDLLAEERPVRVAASFDPDPYFDFTQERPEVWIDEDGERRVRWPENDLLAVRCDGSAHDLLLLAGVEPHLHWSAFTDGLLQCAARAGSRIVVTIGATADGTPHTRRPVVAASTTDPALARRLGLSAPRYQGPTGVVGVLHEQLPRRAITGVSLRVGVPHYLASSQHPRSTAALLQQLEHVLGTPTGHQRLDDEIAHWREMHDAAMDGDEQALDYVAMLEEEYDRRAEEQVSSADEIGAEFERWLRERPDGPDDPDG